MFIGSHVSIKNGYDHAAKAARSIGANAFQYFPKNPRSISIKDFDKQSALNCALYCQEHQIVSVAHTPYPTKLIPEKNGAEKQIVASILNDLEIAEACGSIGIIVHFGTTKNDDPLEGYKKMITILNFVLQKWDGKALLLIENNAGTGSNMGTTLEEMVQIRKLTEKSDKIGFCYDTCHAFASGLWNGENWEELVKKGLALGYWQHLKVIHLNNSKYPTGKRKDRHANLIDGHITQSQWEAFLKSPIIQNIPLILETPNDESHSHKDEINLVKEWLV